MKYLKDYRDIEFPEVFPNLKLVRINTDGDGNCFFHALAMAYFKPYIRQKLDGECFNRKEFIKDLRKDLADKLSEPSKINCNKNNYEILASGELTHLSEFVEDCSLKNMISELSTNGLAVSHIYNEFVSDQLDIDIYILDYEKKDVYMTGTTLNLLYKNRKSVVILYVTGHYDLVGYKNPHFIPTPTNKNENEEKGNKEKKEINEKNECIETCFSPNHSFITQIKNRMKTLQKDDFK